MSSSIPSIDHLQKEKSLKDSHSSAMYNAVLDRCVETIKYTNKYTNKTFLIFTVPETFAGTLESTFTGGGGYYNVNTCIQFLLDSLGSHGYLLEYVEPHQIYIDWGGDITCHSQKQLQFNAKEILKQFPNLQGIEYVFDDAGGGGKSEVTKKRVKRVVRRVKRV